jgi:hypothetical protein
VILLTLVGEDDIGELEKLAKEEAAALEKFAKEAAALEKFAKEAAADGTEALLEFFTGIGAVLAWLGV